MSVLTKLLNEPATQAANRAAVGLPAAPTLAEASAEVAAQEARAATITLLPFEIIAEEHNLGQLETEALDLLLKHDDASELEVMIGKIKRLAVLRYGKIIGLLALLCTLPSCVSLGVNYDAETEKVDIIAHWVPNPKPINPTK